MYLAQPVTSLRTNLPGLRLKGVLALLLVARLGWAVNVSLTDQGIQAEVGNLGQFTISFPNLLSDAQDKTFKPIEKSVTGAKASVKYAGGGTVTISKQADDTIAFVCAGLPTEVRKLRVEMFIDFGFNEGGTWQTGGGQPVPFPKQKPEQPFLFQGNNSSLKLTGAQGKTLSFGLPPYTYQQLQDNREWNWAIYEWVATLPFDPANPHLTLKISESVAAGGEKPVIVADRFGQDMELDWKDKNWPLSWRLTTVLTEALEPHNLSGTGQHAIPPTVPIGEEHS